MIDNFKRIDKQQWLDFSKELCDSKGSGEQKKFLNACANGKDSFLEYIEGLLGNDYIINANGQTISVNHKFSEKDEYENPPTSTQEIIWNTFKQVPIEIVSDHGFWGYVVKRLIEEDKIEPNYLSGSSTIEKVLKSGDSNKIDSCVRRVLRSMCNPPPGRGDRIIYIDFSLGKSYWRWHWADKVAKENLGLNHGEILKILELRIYGSFAEKMYSGKSCISAKNIFGGLLLFLNEKNTDIEIDKDAFIKVADGISRLNVWKALEVQSAEENKKDIKEIYSQSL